MALNEFLTACRKSNSIFVIIAAFFCLIVFPVILVNTALNNLLAVKLDNQKYDTYRKLNEELDKVSGYHQDGFFFHELLSTIFQGAEKSAKPSAFLGKAITRLNKKYDDAFTFIVWDGKGNVMENLTHHQGYRYVLKKIWQTLSAIVKNNDSPDPLAIRNIPQVVSNKSILQNFLGKILVIDHLILPYRKAARPDLILADYSENRPYIWYHIGSKIGILCFIHARLFDRNLGLKEKISGYNSDVNNPIKLGFYRTTHLTEPYTQSNRTHKRELTLSLGQFEASPDSQLETEHLMTAVRILDPHCRVFAFTSKEGHIIDVSLIRRKFLFVVMGFLCPILLGSYLVIFLRKDFFLSIKWKLTLLFVYASGIPLIILGFIAFDYLQQKRTAIINDLQSDLERQIGEFDSRFDSIQLDFEYELQEKLDGMKPKLVNAGFSKKSSDELLDILSAFRPSEAFLIASSSELLSVMTGGERNKLNYSVNLLKSIAGQILQLFNGKFDEDEEELNVDIDPSKLLFSSEGFFRQAIANNGKMMLVALANEYKWTYWKGFLNEKENFYHHILMITWNSRRMQNLFLEKYLHTLEESMPDMVFFAKTRDTATVFPNKRHCDASVFELLRKTAWTKNLFSERITLNGIDYAAFGFSGRLLDETAFVGLYPHALIDKVIFALNRKMLVFAIISVLTALAIGRTLSQQFLTPIHELSEATMAIHRRDFAHRIPNPQKDELGKLAEVFNRVTEGLAELEIARVVQESLFPETSLVRNRFAVFGKSVTMTELGGDYFDFFPVGKDQIAVIMGDVAGHGVPAAILMAMAKTGAFLSLEDDFNPSKFLSNVHSILYNLKKRGIKKMMTLQCMLVDTLSGKAVIANAGHCFPLIVSSEANSAEYLEFESYPLGVMRKTGIEEKQILFRKRDVIVLYSDGIIESKNTDGQQMGFNRWKEFATQHQDTDPKQFYENLYGAYRAWAVEASDDVTIVITSLTT